ncbi:MAG: HEAT repeat domain-containing protein [Gemmatimonadales bacterium]
MDLKSTFVKRFGDLVALLRADPGNDAAQDLALTAAAAAVAEHPLEVEAGVEWSVIPDDLTLKGRLLARSVDHVRIAAGADPSELLALARALAHDVTPLPSTPNVQVELIPLAAQLASVHAEAGSPDRGAELATALQPRSGERRRWEDRRHSARPRWTGNERRLGGDRRLTGERRLYAIAEQRVAIAQLEESLTRSVRNVAWETLLHTVYDLVRLAPKVPAVERRTFGIQVRRGISRNAVEAVVDLAERNAEVRGRATEVLRWLGLDAGEVILDRLRQGEAIGVRAFLYDVLGSMPEVYPMVTPLLQGHHAHEIRHGAALLGRLGRPEAVEALTPLLSHRDERIRAAAVRALGEIHRGSSAEALRDALHHADPKTRAAAADAIGVWRGGALALLLVGALETERDSDAWHAIVSALGRMGTPETCGALSNVALTRRSILRRQGYTTGQRLAAVNALGLSDTPAARTTLERLAREAEGVVRYAADRVLQADRQRAG